jgi:hypothetical protein
MHLDVPINIGGGGGDGFGFGNNSGNLGGVSGGAGYTPVGGSGMQVGGTGANAPFRNMADSDPLRIMSGGPSFGGPRGAFAGFGNGNSGSVLGLMEQLRGKGFSQPSSGYPEATPQQMPNMFPVGSGGFRDMASGGITSLGSYSDGGRLLKGPGDGMSDNIPATIGRKQPARLADGEFVVPADVVSHLGNGSTDAGAKNLYSMMNKVRKARTGNPKQGKQINPGKYIPA